MLEIFALFGVVPALALLDRAARRFVADPGRPPERRYDRRDRPARVGTVDLATAPRRGGAPPRHREVLRGDEVAAA